jgi:hypothetical protein
VVSYFLRYFSSTSTEQISPDSAGRFTSFDPAGFAIFATLRRCRQHLDFDLFALHESRVYSQKKFSSRVQKDFCNEIGTQETVNPAAGRSAY